ncbi:hypothetical protein HanPSC8_Chr03g0087761 [Helianthus annuus]|nr:hypothetical protein HanPSC8_Chr03g0087761 [Helianthus annuus]
MPAAFKRKTTHPPLHQQKKRVIDHKDKDRKKDVPHPRMQFDDATRVEKAKKRVVVKQTESETVSSFLGIYLNLYYIIKETNKRTHVIH